jgi:pilus assembly protein Flp/PilA
LKFNGIDLRDVYPFQPSVTGPQCKKLFDGGSGSMLGMLRAFVKCQSGATAIEYGLIAAGISIAIIAVVNGLVPP